MTIRKFSISLLLSATLLVANSDIPATLNFLAPQSKIEYQVTTPVDDNTSPPKNSLIQISLPDFTPRAITFSQNLIVFVTISVLCGCTSVRTPHITPPDGVLQNTKIRNLDTTRIAANKNIKVNRPFAFPTVFVDPGLSSAIQKLLDQNHDIKQHLYTLSQRLEELKQQTSPLSGVSDSFRVTANGQGDVSLKYQLSFPIDFGMSNRTKTKSAKERLSLSKAELWDIKIKLVGEIQKKWAQVIELEMLISLYKERLGDLNKNLSEIKTRQQYGVAARASDTSIVELDIERTKINILSLEQRLSEFKRLINVLMGRPPNTPISTVRSFQVAARGFGLPAVNPVLIERRPDIAGVVNQINIQGYDHELIRGTLYPQFRVGVEPQLSGSTSPDTINLEAALPGILSSRSINSKARGSQYKHRALIESYHAKMLAALSEVENLKSKANSLRQQSLRLSRAKIAAKKAEELIMDEFRVGSNDIISLLAAQERTFRIEEQIISIRSQRIQNLIDYYLATGARGVWDIISLQNESLPDLSLSPTTRKLFRRST